MDRENWSTNALVGTQTHRPQRYELSQRLARVLMVVVTALALAEVLPAQSGSDRRVRHILVDTEAKADELLKRIENGESFVKLCRQHSFDVATKMLGGDLHWIGHNQVPAFDRAAWSISEVGGLAKCRTQYGWHVIELLETRGDSAVAPDKPRPTPRPETQPAPRRLPPPPLSIQVNLDSAFAKPSDVEVEISVTNTGGESIDFIDPHYWPLGLVVRYLNGRLNQSLTLAKSTEHPELVRKIGPRETISRTYQLKRYVATLTPWPIIRVNWQAARVFANLSRNNTEIARHPRFEELKLSLRAVHNNNDEQQFNIMADYSPKLQYYAMIYSMGQLWVELQDPGIPGLMEFWTDLARSGFYNRRGRVVEPKPFLEYVPKSHFIAGGSQPDGSGYGPRRFDLKQPLPPQQIPAYTFGLEIIEEKGLRYVGSRFVVTLSDRHGMQGKMIPLGRVMSELPDTDRVLSSIESIYSQSKAGATQADVRLCLIYPEKLAPEAVRNSAGAMNGGAANAENPLVQFHTDQGLIEIELYEDAAPNTVANFITLIEKGFYDRMKVHRRVSENHNRGFVQLGSPDASPSGGAGYTIPDEPSRLRHYAGTVAWARGAPNTGSSQFYICLQDQPSFDGKDTVVGQVVGGMKAAENLRVGSVILKALVVRKRDRDYTEFEKHGKR